MSVASPVRRFAGTWRSLHQLALHLATEQSTPARLGWAIFVGILIGMTPFYGFQLLICIAAATLLGLNRAVTYLAANISIPPVMPFLIFGSIQLGNYAWSGHWLPLTLEALRTLDPWQFAKAWLLGSLLLGTLIGAPAGAATYIAMSLYRRRHPASQSPIDRAMAATAERFRSQGRFVFGYVQGKLKHDPVYRQLAERCPLPAPLVDFGCGRGQTAVLLAEMQPGLEVIGIDWDGRKIERAREAARALGGLSFEVGDVREASIPGAGTVLIVDVLHYNPAQVQDAMLRRAAQALRPGGVLYVRDVDGGRGWRATMTRWQERLGRSLGVNRGATLCFRPADEVVAVLRAEGLDARIVPSWGDTPLANVLIEARRPADSAQGRPGPGARAAL